MKGTEGKTKKSKASISIYWIIRTLKRHEQINVLVNYSSILGCLASKRVYANWLTASEGGKSDSCCSCSG